LKGLNSTTQPVLPNNLVAAVVANTAGAVQVVVDPLASQPGSILSPLVSLSEADKGHVFAVLSGGDPFHPYLSDIFEINPNLQIGTDISTLTFITGDLFSNIHDPNPLLLLTNVTVIAANIDLSGLGLLPDLSLGIDPLELCLSLAIGGNAIVCPSAIGEEPGTSEVPEPSSIAVLGAGLASLSLLAFARRKRPVL
jgi:hypothetical protein